MGVWEEGRRVVEGNRGGKGGRGRQGGGSSGKMTELPGGRLSHRLGLRGAPGSPAPA